MKLQTPNPGPAEYSGLIVDDLEAISGTGRVLVWHHCGPFRTCHSLTEDIKSSVDEECYELQY